MTKGTLRIVEPDIAVVSFTGRLIIGESLSVLSDAVAELEGRDAPKIVLDLTEVTYIDSSGIGMLVAVMTRVRNTGGQIRIAFRWPEGILGMIAASLIDADVEAAIAALRSEKKTAPPKKRGW
jgi:anti-anti-sigma factor